MALKVESTAVMMRLKIGLVLFLVALTVGCTSSEWLLSALYNRMDNLLATEVKEYADFSPEQTRQIDLLADQYHLWHRANHLPVYAALLREVETQVAVGELAELHEIEAWASRIEALTREMATCHPINEASDMLRELSDEQVEQILAHGIKEYDEFVEDHVDMTREKRDDKRYKVTKKWLGRIGLDLDSDQQAHLRKTIESEPTVGGEGIELWMDWHREFVEQLRTRNEDGFDLRINAHIQKLWTLQDDSFPEIIDTKRTLWNQYFAELAASQSEAQRLQFAKWLSKMANNLDSIAADIDTDDQELIAALEGQGVCETKLPERAVTAATDL